jgi:hypothetical protein
MDWDDEPNEKDLQAALERNRNWVSPEELAALGLERATGFRTPDGGPESPVDQATRIMRENAPLAAMTLVKLAKRGDSETVRLRASVEILNRAAATGGGEDGGDPWDGVYNAVLTDTQNAEAARTTKDELEAKGVTPQGIEDKDLPR